MVEQTRVLLDADIEHWALNGFGPWSFVERSTDAFVGRGGLRRTVVGGRSEVELLYAIVDDRWGRGYATEIARAAVAVARQIGLTDLVGFTLTTNTASRRVLEKAGLTFAREIEHAGLPHWLGRLTASAPEPS